MQALYQWQLTGQSYAELLNQYAQDDGFADADREYFEALLKGITEVERALDAELGCWSTARSRSSIRSSMPCC